MTAAPRTAAGLWDMMKREGMDPSGPRPKDRKRRDNTESRIQQAVIRWWDNESHLRKLHTFLLFKISNDGLRSPAMGSIMKREGLRAGCPDLMLAIARGKYHGLFLELKKPDGKVTPVQHLFLGQLAAQGYAAFACYSYEQATRLITGYLDRRKAVSQSLSDNLQCGEFAPKSPEHLEMKAELDSDDHDDAMIADEARDAMRNLPLVAASAARHRTDTF